MVVSTRRYTIEEFEEFIHLPENVDRSYEFIAGEIVEVVANNYSSQIAVTLAFFIQLHLREKGVAGYVTGADGGYIVAGERYIPDVAYISAQRQPQPSRDAYNPNPPDLAVEVISDPESRNKLDKLRVKITNYLADQVVAWVVNPDRRIIEIHRAGHRVQILGADDTLDGGDVLPGFALAVKDIFPEETSTD
jgi:Uma2 family endonuclease